MGFFDNIKDASTHSTASNATDLHYVVLQVTLKEKFFGTGSGTFDSIRRCLQFRIS